MVRLLQKRKKKPSCVREDERSLQHVRGLCQRKVISHINKAYSPAFVILAPYFIFNFTSPSLSLRAYRVATSSTFSHFKDKLQNTETTSEC